MQPELIETILVDAQRHAAAGAAPEAAGSLLQGAGLCWAGPAVEADILVAALALSAPGPHRLRLLVARRRPQHPDRPPPPLPCRK